MDMFKLKYKGVFDIPAGDGSCVITLTDMEEKRVLSVMTDRHLAFELKAHGEKSSEVKTHLVDVLCKVLESQNFKEQYAICIDAKKDFGFTGFLEQQETGEKIPVKCDEAVLLAVVTGMAMYASMDAFRYFSTPFDQTVHTVALPILGLPDALLKKALDQAIKEENYESASFIRDEIKRRESAASKKEL